MTSNTFQAGEIQLSERASFTGSVRRFNAMDRLLQSPAL